MIKDFINKIIKYKESIPLGKDLKKSVYNDFTPSDTLSKTDETINALHWALNNHKVKNIALTGPYGAGKSSVIESYLKLYKLKNVIKISLATFDGKSLNKVNQLIGEKKFDEAKITEKEFEDELEKGILKQLFYKVSADEIPLSRYRKLHHTGLWKYIVGVGIMLLVMLSASYLIFPNEFQNKFLVYKSIFNLTEHRIKGMAALGVVVVGMAQGIRYIVSKFFIKEVSFGDVSAKSEEISKDSILNKNIDEMLYFFEKTNYNIVFIEDLDRFDSTSIFIKLREINTILNNYDVLKKKNSLCICS